MTDEDWLEGVSEPAAAWLRLLHQQVEAEVEAHACPADHEQGEYARQIGEEVARRWEMLTAQEQLEASRAQGRELARLQTLAGRAH